MKQNARQLVGGGGNGLGSSQAGAHAAIVGAQIRLAAMQRLSRDSQGPVQPVTRPAGFAGQDLAATWPEPQFLRLTAHSNREREKIYESTAENPYADPERIFQVWKTAPGWALLPITALILLFSLGATRTISYFTLRVTFYISLLFVVAVALLTVLFEPAQITRWLLRKSAYERYRRRVLTGPTIASRARAVWNYLLSLMPAGIGVICFSTILLIAIGLDLFYPFRNLAIWRGQIGGLHSGGHYEKLKMADFASLAPQSDLSNSFLGSALMSKTLLPNIKLTGARIDNATLDSAEMIENQLRRAVLQGSSLRSADLSASDATGADFSNADCQDTKFQGADLTNVNFYRCAAVYGRFPS
jgi:hypothetical protein